MLQETLTHIKKELSSFYKMYEMIVDYYSKDHDDFPQYRVALVLVQNAAFNGCRTFGYDLDREVAKMKDIINVLRTMSEYYKDEHVIVMAYNEVFYTFDGNEKSEEIDKW